MKYIQSKQSRHKNGVIDLRSATLYKKTKPAQVFSFNQEPNFVKHLRAANIFQPNFRKC